MTYQTFFFFGGVRASFVVVALFLFMKTLALRWNALPCGEFYKNYLLCSLSLLLLPYLVSFSWTLIPFSFTFSNSLQQSLSLFFWYVSPPFCPLHSAFFCSLSLGTCQTECKNWKIDTTGTGTGTGTCCAEKNS